MSKTFTTVEVVVRHSQPAKVRTGTRKVPVVTEISLFLGPQLLAQKNIGGFYNAEQAKAEFLRNPTTYKEGIPNGRQVALGNLKAKAA
jgi:hypothetical protein